LVRAVTGPRPGLTRLSVAPREKPGVFSTTTGLRSPRLRWPAVRELKALLLITS
jgi:hypothetical protein